MALSKIKAPSIADDSITVDQIADTAVHGRRNHIINGGFQCWQRTEDKENTGTGWGYWSVDRFQSNKGRFRKTTDTVDGRTVNVLQIDPSSGVYNGGRGVFTMIEDWNVYDKKTTLSVWVKADAATTANFGQLYDYGASSTADAGTTINVTTSWQRFTITYDAQTFTQAAGQYLLGSLVDGRTYYIAMAQLEDGDKASPFEHRSYDEELASCQRYFQYFPSGAMGRWNSSTAVEVGTSFPVPMRAKPTMSINPADATCYIFRVGITVNTSTITAINSIYASDTGAIPALTTTNTSTPSAGEMAVYDTDGTKNAIFCDAEL